ncbi:hypothetical protein I4F81_001963 [Pyropia yezoensis]|uniref:Uncharacterized protein n=1 Tax=Pyropia yezoensis TaxID=2788 RepID=A0ACC3BN23_PYRYE|nr:hypothetical protein I4F81_001963 [Neopyropia yezoensis]
MVLATNAFYMFVSVNHCEALNLLYAEAVFASGGKFGYCTDGEEWGSFGKKLLGGAWRPPSRQTMSSKYVNLVFSKVDADVCEILRSMAGGCFECDGWTGPNGDQVFSALFCGPLPFYISSFRLHGDRETDDVLVTKVKEQMALPFMPSGTTWRDQHNTGIVTDSPNVNRSARRKLIDGGDFTYAYGCASHAMNNLCRDILKLPGACHVLSFCTALARFFGNYHLPREHLRRQQALEPGRTPTIKLFSPTRLTGSAALLGTILSNRGDISTVLFKAKQKTIGMDFPPSLFDAVMEPKNWDNLRMWEPVLRCVTAITDYLQADTTPLSGIHASFLCLEASLLPSAEAHITRESILGLLKSRYGTIFSYAHMLAFYLGPRFLPFHEASRAPVVKPFTGTDAAMCLAAAKRLIRPSPDTEQAVVVTQVTQAILGSFPFFGRRTTSECA